MKSFVVAVMLYAALTCNALPCNTQYDVLLETFGEGVLAELRAGQPSSSKVKLAIKSHGGEVSFTKLCPNS
jgi:hypothetical protein